MEYENTSLWQRSLEMANDNKDPFRDLLRDEFYGFRSRIGVLLDKIRTDFDNLTVHDLTHADELWRIGSLLAGENFPINPLEGFVIGGAFLLHDAALCFDAYENGKSGVRSTLAWKDALAFESNRSEPSDDTTPEDRADFAAVRLLHAKEAANLAERNWNESQSGSPLFLIADSHIRQHLGPLIGRIAASHHLNVEDLVQNFPATFSAPGDFPSEWQIDSLKLAFLLRCADALHIDNKRAPDHLYALRRRSGISHDHWRAQNWLGRPDEDLACPKNETVIVTSTRPFPKEEARAWWVAYDALSVANKEIDQANRFLGERNGKLSTPLKIKRVRGCDSLEEMVKLLPTSGWHPCSAALHVSNIESLITSLGGTKLYGENQEFHVSIREIIQNARDAVSARREVNPGYEGEIFITYDEDNNLIKVEDDGIGMSERVLTGPLLDFGASLWSSDLVRSEIPGLISSSFRSAGKFGIGFFSVFMVGASVSISSRRYENGYSTTATLDFANGLSLRPILTRGQVEGFQRSTRVVIQLKSRPTFSEGTDYVLHSKIQDSAKIDAKPKISVLQYLLSLCACLDVQVKFTNGNSSEPLLIHNKLPSSQAEYVDWLNKFTFVGAPQSPETIHAIARNISRLRPIFNNGRQIGLAAISVSETLRHRVSIGRLTADYFPSKILQSGEETIIGFIETGTETARRGAKPLSHSNPIYYEWALEQHKLLESERLSISERANAASTLAKFGIDSRSLAKLVLFIDGERKVVDFDEIIEHLKTNPIALYKSPFGNFLEIYNSFTEFPGAALLKIIGDRWNWLEFDENLIPIRDCSIADFIQRTADECGLKIKWEKRFGVRKMDMMGEVDGILVSLVN
jgi:hypothetical protein